MIIEFVAELQSAQRTAEQRATERHRKKTSHRSTQKNTEKILMQMGLVRHGLDSSRQIGTGRDDGEQSQKPTENQHVAANRRENRGVKGSRRRNNVKRPCLPPACHAGLSYAVPTGRNEGGCPDFCFLRHPTPIPFRMTPDPTAAKNNAGSSNRIATTSNRPLIIPIGASRSSKFANLKLRIVHQTSKIPWTTRVCAYLRSASIKAPAPANTAAQTQG